jgi:hypothetical protein
MFHKISVSKLYERVQQTEYTSVQTSSNAENSIHVTLKCPTISERETVQNRFKTKMFADGMKHIEAELKRKLNVESMSLTAKLVVTDDAVSNFGESYCFIKHVDNETNSYYYVCEHITFI